MSSQRKSRQNRRLEEVRASRTLHLIDIENLAAGRAVTVEVVRAVCRLTRRYLPPNSRDHYAIATGSPAALWALDVWGDAQRLFRGGPDGADYALLSVLESDVPRRYEHVAIYSGDGIFADAVSTLGVDLTTTVVARKGSLSKRLRLAAHRVILLPSPEEPSHPAGPQLRSA